MMDKEVKKQWVEALRSGKYEQGTGKLRSTDNKFCCLGVLCDISGLGKWEVTSPTTYSYNTGVIYSDATVLPRNVYEKAGLTSNNPSVENTTGYGSNSLSLFNDGSGGVPEHNFNQIADLIEKHL